MIYLQALSKEEEALLKCEEIAQDTHSDTNFETSGCYKTLQSTSKGIPWTLWDLFQGQWVQERHLSGRYRRGEGHYVPYKITLVIVFMFPEMFCL